MLIKADRKSKLSLAFVALSGAMAGFLNGFLGAGGGIILMYMYSRLNSDTSLSAGRDNFASVVASVLPLSVVSAINYSARGSFTAEGLPVFVIPALAGGVFGAYLTDKLSTKTLKLIFAVIMIVAGVNMVL